MIRRSQTAEHHSLLGAIVLLLTLGFAGCADAPAAMDLPAGGGQAVLALSPSFGAALAAEDAAPINRIRVTVFLVSTGGILGEPQVFDVDATAGSWDLDIPIDIPNVPNPQVTLQVELINVTGGVETVEWSGMSEAIPLNSTATTSASPEINVVRGPVANLTVSEVNATGPSELRAGETATLSATTTGSSTAQIFWSSLDPAVGSVTAQGVFQALAKGTARVVALAGAAADTLAIQVLPAIGQVVVSPQNATVVALAVEVSFTVEVRDTDGNPIEGETVSWTVADEAVLAPQGGGVFLSAGNGVTQVTATSDSDPSISASTRIEVRQFPKRAEVTPATDTLEAVGETSQFEALAYDLNDQLIQDATFHWTSADEAVATVDQTGLATAQGGGETEITAEALAPDLALVGAVGPGKVENGTGITGSATLTVDLPITLAIVPAAATLEAIDATTTLVAEARDGAGELVTGFTYTWSSSDPGVATVDANGVVTAVKDGQTTISATGAGTSATALVTVKQKVVALRWVQQPTDVDATQVFSPTPSVEAVDANGHRVTSFEGEVSVSAQFQGYGEAPDPAAPRYGVSQSGPQPQVGELGSTVLAIQGLALFSALHMNSMSYGYFRLQAYTLFLGALLTVWSIVFWVNCYC